MTKKKGHSKGGGPGGDREMEDDDASTDEEPPSGPTDNINCQEVALQRSNDKSHPTSPRCPHVGKAVNVSAIKKALKVIEISLLSNIFRSGQKIVVDTKLHSRNS